MNKKSFFDEFKEFALRGNVVDLAVGVIIGAAFQAIVNSLIEDILSPLLGLVLREDFSALSLDLFDGSVSIRSWWGWPSTPQGRCEIIYTFYPSGAVDMHMRCRAEKEAGDMPVFGLQWKTDADYEHIRYYGYGPQENYCDRKEGARLGIWETTSEANLSRYLRPQECGNRTGVRWATVTDYKGRGIRVSGNGIEFCALPYTSHELENAAHSNELPERHYTVIRAALAQMGVGGDDSWGARTHPEYLIDTRKELEFKLTLEPVYG